MSGAQLLSRSVQRLAAQAIGAKQPDLAGLMAAWPDVVGHEWAARCTPLAFIRGRGGQNAMLEIAVTSGEALLVQHETPVLVSRINGYFGGPMIKGLRLTQIDPPAQGRRKPVKEYEPLPVDGIDDPELAATLGRLGAAIRDSAKGR